MRGEREKKSQNESARAFFTFLACKMPCEQFLNSFSCNFTRGMGRSKRAYFQVIRTLFVFGTHTPGQSRTELRFVVVAKLKNVLMLKYWYMH